MNNKVLIASNTTWSILSFRKSLIKELIGSGWHVTVVAPFDYRVEEIASLGCEYIPLKINSKTVNPFTDIMLFFRLFNILKLAKPDIVLCQTVKINIYGALAARILKVKVINNVTGLGTAFIHAGWRTYVVSKLYKFGLAKSSAVCFENSDDLELFVEKSIVCRRNSKVLPIAGVDLDQYSPILKNDDHGRKIFLFLSRLIKDKGVMEYAEAARIIKSRIPDVEFQIIGYTNSDNHSSLTNEELDDMTRNGDIKYLGSPQDVRKYLAEADYIILPSYREGLPMTLLEAAGMGRPIITTNVPGCKEVVDHGINGFLVRPKDSYDLAEKMQMMTLLSKEELLNMGKRGRDKVANKFSSKDIVKDQLILIDQIGIG